MDTTSALYDIAEGQAGYFTLAQAQAAGVLRQYIQHHLRRGRLLRVAHGVYRLRQFPAQPFEDMVVACLWVGSGAAISHESALTVYALSDAMPAVLHITVPRPFRGKRAGVVLHHQPLTEKEWTFREAVPVTSIERTLADVAEQGDRHLATEAAREALGRGVVTRKRLGAYLQTRPAAEAALRSVLERVKA